MNDSWIKFQRAWQLFKILESEINAFMAIEPVRIQLLEELPGRVTVKLERLVEIPRHFPLLIGELIHNARSSLDAATFQLVQKKFPGEMPLYEMRKIKYSIEDSWKAFSGKSKWHANQLNLLELVSISSQQPFEFVKWIDNENIAEAIKWSPLARLREISNLDKHRNIKLLNIEPSMFMIVNGPETNLGQSSFSQLPWKNGDIIFTFTYDNQKMKAPEVKAEFSICFPEDARPLNVRPLTQTLIGILNAVEFTLRDFDRFDEKFY